MHEQTPDREKIGQLLIREGAIDESQLEQALAIQAEQATYRPLGEILGGLGFISGRVFHDVLLKYRKQIRLGELLVKMRVITDDRLAEALKAQNHTKKKLGQILVDWGCVTRSRLVDALSVQLGVPGMDHIADAPDEGLLGNVSTAFLRSKKALPLGYDTDNRVLHVLMEDPTDKETITDLEKIFKIDIEPIMLRKDSVEHVFDELFDVWHRAR